MSWRKSTTRKDTGLTAAASWACISHAARDVRWWAIAVTSGVAKRAKTAQETCEQSGDRRVSRSRFGTAASYANPSSPNAGAL